MKKVRVCTNHPQLGIYNCGKCGTTLEYVEDHGCPEDRQKHPSEPIFMDDLKLPDNPYHVDPVLPDQCKHTPWVEAVKRKKAYEPAQDLLSRLRIIQTLVDSAIQEIEQGAE